MRLTEILKPANIKMPLTATDKAGAIGELVDLLAANGDVTDPRKLLEAVLEREATRTTGIGSGVAIPHGRSAGVDHLVLAVGRPAKPIDFGSVDGKPVSFIWLLGSPPDKTTPHIHALGRVSRLMTLDDFRLTLSQAKSPDAFYDAVSKQEASM